MTKIGHDGHRHAGLMSHEIEARMVVLEIVAMTSLAMVLDTSDDGDPARGSDMLQLIRETVNQRCSELDLSSGATGMAGRYADELVSTAMHSLYPDNSQGR